MNNSVHSKNASLIHQVRWIAMIVTVTFCKSFSADAVDSTQPAPKTDSIVQIDSKLPAPSSDTIHEVIKVNVPDNQPTNEAAPLVEKHHSENNAFESNPFQPAGHNFSLFDFGRIISLGATGSYFHYAEKISTDEYAGQQLFGAPKSTEYGPVWGISFSETFYSRLNGLWLKPKICAMGGFGMQYDGSSQGKSVTNGKGDTIGIGFDPIQFPKNNYFLVPGADVGITFGNRSLPSVLFTGIECSIWYRSLLDSRYSYYSGISNSETYIGWAAPVGLLVTDPIAPDCAVGIEARALWMFSGTMQVSFNSGSDTLHSFPVVNLGSRASFRIEPFYIKKKSDDQAIKISVFFQVNNIGKSDTQLETITIGDISGIPHKFFFEPTSRTYWIGANCSIEFLRKQ
jgi:hypothetical protein